jgi:hypothetical protein
MAHDDEIGSDLPSELSDFFGRLASDQSGNLEQCNL